MMARKKGFVSALAGLAMLATGSGHAFALDGEIAIEGIDQETRCAIGFGKKCGIDYAVKRGLLATGTRPVFPEGLFCRTIDDTWAMDYSFKRKRTSFHGGIDMPAPYATPIIAVADGVVVGKFPATNGQRGIEIVLRHRPQDTGLPFWIYTQYAHFQEMPDLQLGQSIEKGQALGPTGNSGTDSFTGAQNKRRRPAIHFAVTYAHRGDYARTDQAVVPAEGNWMDPVALYRRMAPFDSLAVKAMTAAEKEIPIPVKVDDGSFKPVTTKLVWPYECSHRPLAQSPRNSDQKERKSLHSKKSSGSGKCRDGNVDACREKCDDGNQRACKSLKTLTQ
ncbi:MAG: M23 family metallopeptidase [Rhodospirillales bacterium]|nr:M23 family metallopeptidase [Rhodospirillales bacterium]